jgi:tetratricopeptide (TPR) repeat protein
VILLLLGLLTVQQAAPPMSVRGATSGAEFQITLSWNAPVEFMQSSTTRELTLLFNRSVGSPVLDTLSRDFPLWIEGATSGYDSLLIRSAQEVTYTVEKTGNDVLVRLVPRGTAPVSEATDRKADFRLDILRAQLLSRNGQLNDALGLLDRLATEYPTETLVFLNRGEIHLRRSQWRQALSAYKHILEIDPGNDDARNAIETPIIAVQKSNFRVDAIRRLVRGSQREDIQQASGHFLFRDAFRIGYSAARNEMQFQGVRTKAYRGELFAQYDFRGGALIRGGFLGSERTRGGTMQLGAPFARGTLHMQVDYQRPFWEFVESVRSEGTRDRIEIRRQQDLAPGFAIRGSAYANRYGLGTQKNSATSLAFDAGVVKTFGFIRVFGFEYLFDSEYVKSHSNLALPIISRQVHGGDAFFDVDFYRRLRVEGFGGYTLDQKGGRGPFYGGRVTFHRGWFEAQLAYDRRLNSVATGQVVTRYDAHILWRF